MTAIKRPVVVAVVAVLAMVSAACNSTNRLADPASRSQTVNAGEGNTGVGGDSGTPTTLAAGETGAVPGTGRATGSTARGGTAGTGVPGTATSGPGQMALGVTATEIKIGINLVKGGEAMGNLIGAALNFGDTEAQANAVVNYINSKGGIAGRRIVPVFYTFDLARPGLADGQSEQEACVRWTEDNRVFAAINVALARVALLVCLAKRGVPGVHLGMPMDEQMLKTYRDYWYSGFGGTGLTLDRLAEKQVKAFGARGWFGPNAVVGIEYFDDPSYKKVVDEQFVPLLKAQGVKKVVLQAAPRGGTQATSYVVRFRDEGVTNVLFLGEGGLYPLFFMRAADTQGYYPKYGLNTNMAPESGLQRTAPATQLRNAIGMGWAPILDVDAAHDPGPVSPANTLCLDIQRGAGQDMSARQPAITALSYCHSLFLLRDALALQRNITVGGLSQGIAALGSSFVSPGSFATRWSSTMHDGVDGYRDFVFDMGCKCFVYTSGTKLFP